MQPDADSDRLEPSREQIASNREDHWDLSNSQPRGVAEEMFVSGRHMVVVTPRTSALDPAEASNIFHIDHGLSPLAGNEAMQKAPFGLFRSKQPAETSGKTEHKRNRLSSSYRSYGSESPLNSPITDEVSGPSHRSSSGASAPRSIIDDNAHGLNTRLTRSDYAVEQIEDEEEQDREEPSYSSGGDIHKREQSQSQQQQLELEEASPLATEIPTASAATTGRGAATAREAPEDSATNTRSHTSTSSNTHHINTTPSYSYQSSTLKSNKSDSRKKGRFWSNWGSNFGIGLSSSSAANNSHDLNQRGSPQAAAGQAANNNNPSSPATAAPHHPRKLTKRERPTAQRNQPSSSKPSSKPTSPREDTFAPRNLQRHSVIGLPFQTELLEASVSSLDDLSEKNLYPDSTFNTASSQAQGEAAPQKTAARERLGRVAHQRTASTEEYAFVGSAGTSAQKSRLEPNYSDQHYPSSRPSSRQSIDPPSPSEISYTLSHQRTTSSQNSSITKGFMGSQNNQQQAGGRNTDAQSNSREGQYGATLGVSNQQPTSYRNTPQASPMVQENSNPGQGRTTPPPVGGGNKSREDLADLNVQQLLSRHEELNDKYRKVKKYYFDKDAQVQQLQNTLAHQRLSQSRTSLDDNEYANRFSRLDGAINNLAFNIRKDWKAVPLWLAPCVNKDATTAVTKEMTAVGRACISRWLVDEVFDRYFHPGLEPHLSSQLKIIERNLRRFAPPPTADEEKESLLAKISNWRLATLDGLQDMLGSNDSTEYRTALTKLLVDMLTQDLKDNLKEPPPPGLDAGVVGIIELAVGIAANLPLESRDVYVDYIMPGTIVNDSYMKVEAALPALTNPGEGPAEPDRQSVGSAEDRDEDEQKEQGGKKKGMLSNLMGSNRKVGSRGNDSQSSMPKEDRVRFAAFMSVEVRGKNMLIKAPVYV